VQLFPLPGRNKIKLDCFHNVLRLIQLFKSFIVIFGVENEAVIRVNDALRTAEGPVEVNVAFIVFSATLLRKKSFEITEIISTDTLARCDIPQVTFITYPAKVLCLVLGYVVTWKMSVKM